MTPLPRRATPAQLLRRQAPHQHLPSQHEQLIGALVPPYLNTRPAPTVAPLPELPAPALTGPDRFALTGEESAPILCRSDALDALNAVVLGMARLDMSGRLRQRPLLAALGWGPGQRVDIDARHGVIIVAAEPDGAHRIDARGALSLPSAPRQMCRIPAPASVVLAAVVAQQTLTVYPADLVAHLLTSHHAILTGAVPAAGDSPQHCTEGRW